MTMFDVLHSARNDLGVPVHRRDPRPVTAAATSSLVARVIARYTVPAEPILKVATEPQDFAHWSTLYRRAFPWSGITVPAAALGRPGVAAAVKKGGHCVDVHSDEELTLAVTAGIAPVRIVVHDDAGNSGLIRRGVTLGTGRFVIGSTETASTLARCVPEPHRVFAEVTTDDRKVVNAVLANPGLQLIGLHVRMESATPPMRRYTEVVAELIAQMAEIRYEHGVLLTRVSVAGGGALHPHPLTRGSLTDVAAGVEDAVDDACARFRFPRPALVLAPTW